MYHRVWGLLAVLLGVGMPVTARCAPTDARLPNLVRNILAYVSNTPYPVRPARKAIYVGDTVGARYLKYAGISADDYGGGAPTRDQVLIVGRGGGGEGNTDPR